MTIDQNHSTHGRERQLTAEFGELLSTADLARLLRYRTVAAVRKARLRGALQIPMQRLPGRRGWYATARSVAAYLDRLDSLPSTHPETPID